MSEAETPDTEPFEQEESGSPSPDAGQAPTERRRQGLLWAGAIAALLAFITLACLYVSAALWVRFLGSEPAATTLLEQQAIAPLAQEAVPMLEEALPAQKGEFLALETLPMVQPEAAAAAQPFALRSSPGTLPTIEYFWADPAAVRTGQCSTLRWGAVLGASWAGIEPGIGGIGTPGDRVVCPAATTTYILTAEGPGGRTYASATVGVGAGDQTGSVTLGSEAPLDGYRSNDGRGSIKHDILAANAEFNPAGVEVVWRGFMSFDLSAIPRRRSIRGAELRFFQVRVGGEPYRKLGRLVLEHVVYGDRLDDAAFHVAPMDALTLEPLTARRTWYVVSAPRLREWIAQDRASGRHRLQVRVRWEQETDGDGLEDYVSIESPENFFGTGNAPQLRVTWGP